MYFTFRFVIFYIKAYNCLQVVYLIVAFRVFYVRAGYLIIVHHS